MKTYVALTFNNEQLNIETIYFTENYLRIAKVNPATAKDYTDDEKKVLPVAALTAPEEAYMGITSYKPKALLWFDEAATQAIVKYTDALIVKDNTIVTAEGTEVAKACSYLKDID